MCSPKDCGIFYVKAVSLNKSLYRLNQASRSWYAHLAAYFKSVSFNQPAADACGFRLIEGGQMAVTVAVCVDDTFAVGFKRRCDQVSDGLN